MAIIAKSSGETTQRELIPAGTYLARYYSMVHLGTVKQSYLGEEKWTNLVRITWELPTELKCFNSDKGEQPCVISKEVTLSMNEKSTLRALLTGWRGKAFTEDEAKEFDVAKLLGKPCMISIFHQASKSNPEKVYERIASISPVMKGMECPAQINPTFEFSVLDYNQAKFDSMPEFMKEMVRGSKEFQQLLQPKPVAQPTQVAQAPVINSVDDLIDDLPF
jgi:hypothetical protein